ncbi:MAG: hypothetical protein EOO77_20905 [Oxalobacteraceae bacterium]|nr:MAG: hypothetical protein EOO77_20905 [Oxalobacteraceae bacterium]
MVIEPVILSKTTKYYQLAGTIQALYRTRMRNHQPMRRAGEMKAQGLSVEVIAIRLGVSRGQASKLVKRAREADQSLGHDAP